MQFIRFEFIYLKKHNYSRLCLNNQKNILKFGLEKILQ